MNDSVGSGKRRCWKSGCHSLVHHFREVATGGRCGRATQLLLMPYLHIQPLAQWKGSGNDVLKNNHLEAVFHRLISYQQWPCPVGSSLLLPTFVSTTRRFDSKNLMYRIMIAPAESCIARGERERGESHMPRAWSAEVVTDLDHPPW